MFYQHMCDTILDIRLLCLTAAGRSYLSRNVSLLRALMQNLQVEEKDVLARENSLGCLQKLSLRSVQGDNTHLFNILLM